MYYHNRIKNFILPYMLKMYFTIKYIFILKSISKPAIERNFLNMIKKNACMQNVQLTSHLAVKVSMFSKIGNDLIFSSITTSFLH